FGDGLLLAGGRYFIEAGGFRGDLLHWDGARVTKLALPPGTSRLRALHSLGDEMPAVGDGGQALVIAGDEAHRLDARQPHDLLGLAVADAGGVVAVGDFGTVLTLAPDVPAPAVRAARAPVWDRVETGTDRQLWGI